MSKETADKDAVRSRLEELSKAALEPAVTVHAPPVTRAVSTSPAAYVTDYRDFRHMVAPPTPDAPDAPAPKRKKASTVPLSKSQLETQYIHQKDAEFVQEYGIIKDDKGNYKRIPRIERVQPTAERC